MPSHICDEQRWNFKKTDCNWLLPVQFNLPYPRLLARAFCK